MPALVVRLCESIRCPRGQTGDIAATAAWNQHSSRKSRRMPSQRPALRLLTAKAARPLPQVSTRQAWQRWWFGRLVRACDSVLQLLLYSNVVLTGETSSPVSSLLRWVHQLPVCAPGRLTCSSAHMPSRSRQIWGNGTRGGCEGRMREQIRHGPCRAGGLACLPGFKERLEAELRPLCRPTWSLRSMYQPTRSPMHGRQDQGGDGAAPVQGGLNPPPWITPL